MEETGPEILGLQAWSVDHMPVSLGKPEQQHEQTSIWQAWIRRVTSGGIDIGIALMG
jgi:hypothetical protein